MAHIKQLTCMDGRPVEVDFARLIETRSEQRGATLVLTTEGCGSAERQFILRKHLTEYISVAIFKVGRRSGSVKGDALIWLLKQLLASAFLTSARPHLGYRLRLSGRLHRLFSG